MCAKLPGQRDTQSAVAISIDCSVGRISLTDMTEAGTFSYNFESRRKLGLPRLVDGERIRVHYSCVRNGGDC